MTYETVANDTPAPPCLCGEGCAKFYLSWRLKLGPTVDTDPQFRGVRLIEAGDKPILGAYGHLRRLHAKPTAKMPA